jgi:hypothetical protein
MTPPGRTPHDGGMAGTLWRAAAYNVAWGGPALLMLQVG